MGIASRTSWTSVACAALLLFAGCRGAGLFPNLRPGSLVIGPEATKEDVVALVNRNITGAEGQSGLMSWRATNAKFHMSPLPMAVPGEVLVEAPRNFRIRVSHPIGGGEELDVGSNNDEFWIWQKEMNPPYLLTAHHEDMPLAMQVFRVPFQPDWIMEVFGVIPIEADQYRLQRDPRLQHVELIADTQTPGGQQVRKVVKVDSRRGWVSEYRLETPEGKLIASAHLEDYEATPQTKLLIPKTIRIQWPDQDLTLTARLGDVVINPPELPAMAWQVPEKQGFKQLDMGAYARSLSANPNAIQHAGFDSPQATGTPPATSGESTAVPPGWPSTSADRPETSLLPDDFGQAGGGAATSGGSTGAAPFPMTADLADAGDPFMQEAMSQTADPRGLPSFGAPEFGAVDDPQATLGSDPFANDTDALYQRGGYPQRRSLSPQLPGTTATRPGSVSEPPLPPTGRVRLDALSP
jgi:hypothetical protein